VQESWITDKPQHKPFSIGTQVWLEGTNTKLPSNITPKLAPRRYGPFKVVSQVLPVTYKLQLPQNWQIYDVFHASLLTPYKEMEQHGPNFLEPPPDIIEGEPEWEVEKIIKMCLLLRALPMPPYLKRRSHIKTPSPPDPTLKPSYSQVVKTKIPPHDPGKQARDPRKVTYDISHGPLPVLAACDPTCDNKQPCDPTHFGCATCPLIGT